MLNYSINTAALKAKSKFFLYLVPVGVPTLKSQSVKHIYVFISFMGPLKWIQLFVPL